VENFEHLTYLTYRFDLNKDFLVYFSCLGQCFRNLRASRGIHFYFAPIFTMLSVFGTNMIGRKIA
jgi:hypothetical protein